MSPSTPISSAQFALAAAFSWLSRAKGMPAEKRARLSVDEAQQRLMAVREATHVVAERLCCGMPMRWRGGQWLCARGHD